MKTHLTRREFMGTAALAAAGALLPKAARPEIAAYDFESLPRLRETAAKKGILFGAAVDSHNLKKDRRFAEAVSRECNLIVPEYQMKWDTLMPDARGAWHFEGADALYQFAQYHDMKMRGHTLIWHGSFPDWARETLKEGQGQSLMEEHIRAVVSHYRGKIISWDVVNEAIEPKDGLENGLRKTQWLEALGPDYIEKAFRLAHEADPDAQLVYNEYGMDYDAPRAKSVLGLLRRLKEKGAPVHAVGIQAHLKTGQKLRPLEDFCAEVKKTGLEILITELDVWHPAYPSEDKKYDGSAAVITKEFLDIVFTAAKPKQILTWGLSDKYSWLSSPKWNKANNHGARARGLPLDGDCRRKPMWNALHDALLRA